MSDKQKRVERRADERARGKAKLAPTEWSKLTPEEKRKIISRLK